MFRMAGANGGRCQENLCHSETSSQTGRGNPSLFQTAVCFSTALRRTDCHVASLLAMTVEDFTLLYLLRSALGSTLAPPFPSVRAGDCLAAARSRRGSDMPPACHSLPRRRFATLKGAALRGKDFGLARRMLRSHLAPLLGELSRSD